MSNDPTFLGLALELRNIIYELLLVQDEPIEVDARRKHPRIEGQLDHLHLFVLTKVNRQIADEARIVFYGKNTFSILTNGLNRDPNVPAHTRRFFKCSQPCKAVANQKDLLEEQEIKALRYIKHVVFCEHRWHSAFQTWLKQIGDHNVKEMRSLEFDLHDLYRPETTAGYFGLTLQLIQEVNLMHLTNITSTFGQQNCMCTAWIRVTEKRYAPHFGIHMQFDISANRWTMPSFEHFPRGIKDFAMGFKEFVDDFMRRRANVAPESIDVTLIERFLERYTPCDCGGTCTGTCEHVVRFQQLIGSEAMDTSEIRDWTEFWV